MYIALDELFAKDNHNIMRQLSIPWQVFQSKWGEFPVLEAEPFEVELSHTVKKRLKISCHGKLVLGVPCDRCLREVRVPFAVDFHKEIDCKHLDTEDDSDDTQYVVDGSLDMEKMLRDEMLVMWPAKILCKPDCKGICAVCGHDLNAGDCGCDREVLDPRMAAIQDIFKNANREV